MWYNGQEKAGDPVFTFHVQDLITNHGRIFLMAIQPIRKPWRGTMTARERFNRQMHWQSFDRTFNMEKAFSLFLPGLYDLFYFVCIGETDG